jgi:isoaspartyl peptidase/L-asparaginase-like protein (Ntn-hydrolase superfamily)
MRCGFSPHAETHTHLLVGNHILGCLHHAGVVALCRRGRKALDVAHKLAYRRDRVVVGACNGGVHKRCERGQENEKKKQRKEKKRKQTTTQQTKNKQTKKAEQRVSRPQPTVRDTACARAYRADARRP